jgi:hypothetical protein
LLHLSFLYWQILTSVYNPNRASIVVHSAEGVFSHSGTVVGRFEVSEPVTLPGGSVTDVRGFTNDAVDGHDRGLTSWRPFALGRRF